MICTDAATIDSLDAELDAIFAESCTATDPDAIAILIERDRRIRETLDAALTARDRISVAEMLPEYESDLADLNAGIASFPADLTNESAFVRDGFSALVARRDAKAAQVAWMTSYAAGH